MKSNRILVTGANGQLGSEVRAISGKYPEFDFFYTTRRELDICDQNAVEKFVSRNNINSIINCAAYTAVDKAESEQELADKINHLAVKALAEISLKYDIKLIHISTDYVFDGNSYRPYTETDIPNPQSVYGKTKLDGERAMQKINPANSIIIRTSWVYSSYGNNFVKTMLHLGKERKELSVIFDQIGTPTNAGDLAKTILKILPKVKNDSVEIFHYSNEGVCSWYDFATTIFELAGFSTKVNAIETWQYHTIAKRPFYSILNKSKIKETYQLEIPYWKDLLNGYLKKM